MGSVVTEDGEVQQFPMVVRVLLMELSEMKAVVEGDVCVFLVCV